MSHPEVLIALRRARDLTDRGFAQPLTLDSMAQAAHRSKFHFARAFTKAYGETPILFSSSLVHVVITSTPRVRVT